MVDSTMGFSGRLSTENSQVAAVRRRLHSMHHFHYTGQNLHCESVDLADVARLYGTPTYVYSAATMADNTARLAGRLGGLDFQICFANKANGNLAVLRHFANLGAAFDVASGGELRRVLAAGADAKHSVFAGVGKTEAEITLALGQRRIFAFHVESEPETRPDQPRRRASSA